MIGKMFNDIRKDVPRTVYADWQDGEFRCRVMRGPTSLCAYIGVQPDSIFYGIEYNDIPLQCHGGLTFAAIGSDVSNAWPAGYWWIGWDYSHSGDKSIYEMVYVFTDGEHGWTPDEVVAEFSDVLANLRHIKRVERVAYEFVMDEEPIS